MDDDATEFTMDGEACTALGCRHTLGTRCPRTVTIATASVIDMEPRTFAYYSTPLCGRHDGLLRAMAPDRAIAFLAGCVSCDGRIARQRVPPSPLAMLVDTRGMDVEGALKEVGSAVAHAFPEANKLAEAALSFMRQHQHQHKEHNSVDIPVGFTPLAVVVAKDALSVLRRGMNVWSKELCNPKKRMNKATKRVLARLAGCIDQMRVNTTRPQ